jgi:aryl-alcohol dehydrogenase-like predicted oxidoreductase
MARELGLGITPWSPLRYGVLSGKYTRATAKDAKPGRGAWVEASLNERSFAVLDVVRRVAGELGTTPARVALAWVQSRPGVRSTIIGARSVAQLEDNLGALDLTLPAEALAALDEASKPALNFPADFVRGSSMFKRGGTTVNGETAPPWPVAPKTDAERY